MPQHVISRETGTGLIAVGDVDNDGDIDVISGASSGDSSITWHENLNGTGNFSAQLVGLTTGLASVQCVDL